MTLPTSVTIDEAVALLINFPHFDTSYSLLDILSFLAEEAEVRYEKGVAAGLSKSAINELEIDFNFCAARFTMAESLFKQIEMDLSANHFLKTSTNNGITLTFDSLIDWAYQERNIVLSKKQPTKIHPKKEREREYKGLSPTKTKNFYLTFMCLLKAFVSKSGKQFGTVDNLNKKQLAEYISTFSGQSDESIKDRIEEAIEYVEGEKR